MEISKDGKYIVSGQFDIELQTLLRCLTKHSF